MHNTHLEGTLLSLRPERFVLGGLVWILCSAHCHLNSCFLSTLTRRRENPLNSQGCLLSPPAFFFSLVPAGTLPLTLVLLSCALLLLLIFCITVVPRSSSHGPGLHCARCCTNTEQQDLTQGAYSLSIGQETDTWGSIRKQ